MHCEPRLNRCSTNPDRAPRGPSLGGARSATTRLARLHRSGVGRHIRGGRRWRARSRTLAGVAVRIRITSHVRRGGGVGLSRTRRAAATSGTSWFCHAVCGASDSVGYTMAAERPLRRSNKSATRTSDPQCHLGHANLVTTGETRTMLNQERQSGGTASATSSGRGLRGKGTRGPATTHSPHVQQGARH